MSRRLPLALGAFVIWTLITVIGGRLYNGGEAELAQGVTHGINPVFIIAAGFLLGVAVWQGWSDLGLRRGLAPGSLRLLWLPALDILGFLVLAVVLGLPPAAVLVSVLINTLFVGLSEELMFRGVILQALRHRLAIWPAILATSLLFGAVHSLNVFTTGDLLNALLQSCAAFLSGLLFVAIRLRMGSLWPAILTHALWDFATFTMTTAGAEAGGSQPVPSGLVLLVPVLLVLPNGLYGLWLMRHVGRTHARPED